MTEMAGQPPTDRFSSDVGRILTKCGWYAGRDVGERLRLPSDFTVFPAAKQVLREFGGLHCGERGPGIECARATLDLDPSLAEGEADRFHLYSQRIGGRLYPLGEGDDGHYFVAIAEDGRVFLIMDFLMYVADRFDHALEHLLRGRRAHPVDERGNIASA